MTVAGGSPFHLRVKPTGAVCNLDCEHCFFLSKEALYPGSRFRMAEDLLEVYRFLRDGLGARFVQFIPIVERPHVDGVPYAATWARCTCSCST